VTCARAVSAARALARAGALGASLALLAACSDGPGARGDAGDLGAPRVCAPERCTEGVVGTLAVGEGVLDPARPGLLVHRPLEDGDEVRIVAGFQGGQHIWVSLRAGGVQTCLVDARYQLLDAVGVALDATWGGEFYELRDEPGVYELLAYPAFVAHPQRVHRREVVLRAEVSDGCGHLISDEVTVIPVDPRLGDAPVELPSAP
jgi:hypothetical protein